MTVLEKILDVSNKELDSIDLNWYGEFTVGILNYNEWFFGKSGQEHYRLLTYISHLHNNKTILDVGTYYGYSALALSHSTNVISYDIFPYPKTMVDLTNIQWVIGDAIELDKKEIPFILLDTTHDGIYEQQFINHLIDIKWIGLLMMDDIHAFPELNKVWNNIILEKYDITHIGHGSGTGLVVFNG